jgi:predicted ATPase
MSDFVDLQVVGVHGSIKDMEWLQIPALAVLTGENGVGKSQLLEVIAHTYGSVQPEPWSSTRMTMMNQEPINAKAQFIGTDFVRGDVFHSRGNWQPLMNGSASVDSISKAIEELKSDRHKQWFWDVLSRKTGKSAEEIRSLSKPDFRALVTPTLLSTAQYGIGSQSLEFLFLAYQVFEYDAREERLGDSEIIARYGIPPWTLLNEIFIAAGLKYQVEEPSKLSRRFLDDPPRLTVRLRNTDTNAYVPFSKLSSGEKVIMSTVFWRYSAEYADRHYKLLLLDEPDAHLHPSMTKRFIDVIQNVFVKERNVRVIMTTHSPSTVALVPEACLFEMQSVSPRIQRARSKASAISKLSAGFLVTEESSQFVLLEGPEDPAFFQQIWAMLTEKSELADPPRLEASPNLIFVHGQGKQTVVGLIPQLRAAGFTRFHGLVDLDDGKDSVPSNVYVLKRNAAENYLYDPLNIWVLLHIEGRAPSIDGIEVPDGKSDRVRKLGAGDLQKIVDTIFGAFEAAHAEFCGQYDGHQDVKFVGGVVLKYPSWQICGADKDLADRYRKTFGPQWLKTEKLLRSYATLDMIPMELLETFSAIQRSSRCV